MYMMHPYAMKWLQPWRSHWQRPLWKSHCQISWEQRHISWLAWVSDADWYPQL